MRKIEKKLREKIKIIEGERDHFRDQLFRVRDDRRLFREYFARDLKWLIELHGNGHHPNMNYYIEGKAKFMTTVERWDW